VSERRNLVIAILVSLFFGMAGGVAGTLVTIGLTHGGRGPFLTQGRLHERPEGRPGRRPAERGERGQRGRPRMERVLHEELDLSDEQRARIEAILDGARPRYAAVRESTRAEIERVLTPGQRTKLKELEERFPARRRERAGR
jgi:Spy/CpxP family protein refolding chaperone